MPDPIASHLSGWAGCRPMIVSINWAGEVRWIPRHSLNLRRCLSPEMMNSACAVKAASITWLSSGSDWMAWTCMDGITISKVSLKRVMIPNTWFGRSPNLGRLKTLSTSRRMSGDRKLIKTPRDASRRISRECPPNNTPEIKTFVSQTIFTSSSACGYFWSL